MMSHGAIHGYNHLITVTSAVPTKPALHPQHVNPIHGISTVSFMLPLAMPPMYADDPKPSLTPIT